MPFDPAKVEQQVRDTAAKYGVDPNFAADIAFTESSFNPAAKSKAGAQGVMQVMPDTAKALAKRYGKDNIGQGVGYLKDLGDMFDAVPEDQRRHFVAAAYNAGPTRVMDLMEAAKKKGLDPYNISSLADLLPDETAKYVARLADRAGKRGQTGQTVPVETTPATEGELAPVSEPAAPQPRRIQPLGEALMSSLEAGGQRATQAVRQAGESITGLADPFEGEPTIGAALGRSYDTIRDVLHAMGPALFPRGAVGSLAAETAQRTGALEPIRNVPLLGRMAESPEAAATGGELLTAAANLAPTVLNKGARLLSPRLVTKEEQAAALAKNAEVSAQRAAQEAGQPAAGEAAQRVAGDIQGRLASQAGFAGRTAERAEPGALARQPTAATPAVPPTTAEQATGLVDQYGKPVARTITTPGKAAEPARSLTERDYSDTFKAFRRSSERAGQAAIDFDRRVTKQLERLGPRSTTKALAKDPDLAEAILKHATPEEAQVIRAAIESGKPFAKLPFTEEALARFGEKIAQQGSFLSPLLHSAWGGGGLGVLAGTLGAGAPVVGGVTGGVIAGRLALKALEVALASAPSRAILKQLAKVQPGTPDAVRILLAAGADAMGPRRLQPRGE